MESSGMHNTAAACLIAVLFNQVVNLFDFRRFTFEPGFRQRKANDTQTLHGLVFRHWSGFFFFLLIHSSPFFELKQKNFERV
jgi:hypothetical protein